MNIIEKLTTATIIAIFICGIIASVTNVQASTSQKQRYIRLGDDLLERASRPTYSIDAKQMSSIQAIAYYLRAMLEDE